LNESTTTPGDVAADDAAARGRRIGPFELQSVVSRSASGVIYRGWDHELALSVAVKEYLPLRLARRDAAGRVAALDLATAAAFERGLRGFVDEARALARCDHPGLVRVLHLCHAHGTAYRVMPWVAGHTLLDVRRGMTGPPDETAVRELIEELLAALEVYHAAVGVHGGITPQQVLLRDDDRVLLLGPGEARRHGGGHGRVEYVAGDMEPSFAAPEQLGATPGFPLGPWTDFHAVAEVARFSITGLLPPPAGSPPPEPVRTTVERLFFDNPRAGYSASLLRTIDAAAAPEPLARPQSAAQFRDWLAGAPRDDGERQAASLIQRVIEAIPAAVTPAPTEAAIAPVPAPASAPVPAAVPAPPPPPPAEPPIRPVAGRAGAAPLVSFDAQSAPAFEAAPAPAFDATPSSRRHRTRRPSRRAPVLAVLVLSGLTAAAGYTGWQWWKEAARAEVLALPPPAATRPAAPPTAAPSLATPAAAPALAAPTAAPQPTPAPAPPAATAAASDPPATGAALAAAAPAIVAAAPPAAAAPPPVVAEPPPARRAAPAPPPRTTKTSARTPSPRDVCGTRTQFALYRCMQQQCAKAAYTRHAQCVALRGNDRVD
jgi:serine/threonine protein kinase